MPVLWLQHDQTQQGGLALTLMWLNLQYLKEMLIIIIAV